MKKLLFIIALFCTAEVFSQTENDQLIIDSVQREKIHKMPMDTLNSKMPSIPSDSIPKRKNTGDDADPKRSKDSLRKTE